MDKSELKFFIGNKEVGVVKSNTITFADEDDSVSKIPPLQIYSFSCRLSAESQKEMQWFLSRLERIRKYLKQIFRR